MRPVLPRYVSSTSVYQPNGVRKPRHKSSISLLHSVGPYCFKIVQQNQGPIWIVTTFRPAKWRRMVTNNEICAERMCLIYAQRRSGVITPVTTWKAKTNSTSFFTKSHPASWYSTVACNAVSTVSCPNIWDAAALPPRLSLYSAGIPPRANISSAGLPRQT